MNTQSEISVISESLSLCDDRVGDITPLVYQRFFELDTSAASLMEYSDKHMRGRMFASVLELFLSDDPFENDGFLAWELDNHVSAYSVTKGMYESLFKAFIEIVKETLGDAWCTDLERAWNDRIARIMNEVSQRD
jgi:hemoglobin-like flavoprotein